MGLVSFAILLSSMVLPLGEMGGEGENILLELGEDKPRCGMLRDRGEWGEWRE